MILRRLVLAGLAIAAAIAGPSCRKVPLSDIYAAFTLADATWFEAEQTLFVFWEITAEQGISDQSVVEISYVTDAERVDWTPLVDLPWVHLHVPVDCGESGLCGSASLAVTQEPRDVRMRMRYHRDGELALDAFPVYNVIRPGPAHTNRSLVVYGVFDEGNVRIQWRGRHTFPTLRNERVQALGLRREIVVRDARYGDAALTSSGNPYGYGTTCPTSFPSAGLPILSTQDRARFTEQDLPLDASSAPLVCADVTVTDAVGAFTAGAVARKNPEVRPAFPLLRSPARDATPVRFFLGPCDRALDPVHEAMQRQRLQLGDTPTTCTDGWRGVGFVEGLVVAFRNAVEDARASGNDLVLVVALHRDEGEDALASAVEDALAQVVPDERLRASPRLAGAFLFDTDARGLVGSELAPTTLWCPSTGVAADFSATCAIAPDQPDLELGPFSFGTVPILPTREQYTEFVADYSEAQAGEVTALSFRTPRFATVADHVDVDGFGAATFLNDERFEADPDDAFSYCLDEEPGPFVFRTPFLLSEEGQVALAEACAAGELPAELCGPALLGILPLEVLPDWHAAFRDTEYELGLYWAFPFLLRMEYELVLAGSVSAFGFSVPFGLAEPGASFYGAELWTQDSFSLDPLLTQCTRFCDHPTFDSAGVYHVTDPFRTTYAHTCYVPRYPAPGDGGFPLDP